MMVSMLQTVVQLVFVSFVTWQREILLILPECVLGPPLGVVGAVGRVIQVISMLRQCSSGAI
jgi:hypothetical protein